MMEGAKSVLDDKTSTELVVTTLAGFFIVVLTITFENYRSYHSAN